LDAVTENRAPSIFITPLILFLVGIGLFVSLITAQLTLTYLCVLLFSVTVGAKTWSRLGLSRLHSDLRTDRKKLFPDETFTLTVEVENRKLLPIWLQIKVPLAGMLRADSENSPLKKNSGLLSYQRVAFEWRLTAQRRGVYCIGPIEVEAGDPLGFFPESKTANYHEIIVYPRLIPLNPVALPRRDFYGKPAINGLVEDRTYIHGVRDYQCGRPARYIHWKASARYDHLMEKLCEPAQRERVLILVMADRFAEDQTGESFESCLETAASLAVQCDRMRFPVGLATNSRLRGGGKQTVKISRNPGQLSEILEAMARFEPEPATNMIELLRRGGGLSPTVTGVCFTYDLDAGSLELFQYFKYYRIPMVLVVCNGRAKVVTAETNRTEAIYRLDDIRSHGTA
jgi:uncharacterized protein (DUF58 family)